MFPGRSTSMSLEPFTYLHSSSIPGAVPVIFRRPKGGSFPVRSKAVCQITAHRINLISFNLSSSTFLSSTESAMCQQVLFNVIEADHFLAH